jgi:hypothetical protein
MKRMPIERTTSEDLYPPVAADDMRRAWKRFKSKLEQPAPSEQRRWDRATLRVRQAFKDDPRQWTFVARCFAFIRLISEIGIEGFGDWQTSSDRPGVIVFHDAVPDAVAMVPLRDQRFGRIEFLAAVKKISVEKYGKA